MALVRRVIQCTFTLGQGSFGEDGADTVKLPPLRTNATIVKAGGPSMGTAQLQIWGMTLSQMNKLSTLGMAPTLVRRNTVTVTAGDEGGTLGIVFIGTITNAWGEFGAAPDVPFQVEAHTGLIEAVSTAPPSSYTGAADVVVIMESLATRMQLAFENNGVKGQLASPYFWGSPRNQVQACADAAGIEWIIDNGKLAIWPRGGSRGGLIPLVSKDTGMESYPTFTSKGILVKTLFNPSIGYGGRIQVQSSITPACGTWTIYNLAHNLAAQLPGGPWRSTIQAAPPGLVVVS